MAPRTQPDPAEVSIRSERDAYAEAIPPGDVTCACRGPVNARGVYNDRWRTPLTNANLRISDMNGIALNGGLHTYSLASFGTEDGNDIEAIREYLGSVGYSDVQRGPVTIETIPEPSAEEQALTLERQIITALRDFASSMETSIQPWIDEWERSGWWGLLGDFFEAVRNGIVAWWEGEGEFWSAVGDWISNLPEMLEDIAESTFEMAAALWESRGQIVELLRNLANGAVDAFEAGMEMLANLLGSALSHIAQFADIGPLLIDLVSNSAEWAAAMIEMATRTEVLRVLGATTVGILMMIPPNFWAEVVGTGAGYLIPEAIIAILFLVIAGFTGGSAGAALALRLTAFADKVVSKMWTLTGGAGRAILAMFGFLKDMVEKLAELVRLLLQSRRERAVGSTDDEIRMVRNINHNVRIERRTGPRPEEIDSDRVRELGINHEQGNVPDLREGVGGARYESATGRTLSRSTTEGVDFYDGDTPISLKGPLANKKTGELLSITDRMVDGLANSVVSGAKLNTAARDIVVDTLGLSDLQRDRLIDTISSGLADYDRMPTNIIIMD